MARQSPQLAIDNTGGARGGGHLPPAGGGGNYDDMEPRVAKLENDMTDIKVLLGKIETRLDSIDRNMATKLDLSESERRINERIGTVDGRVSKLEGSLESKLGYWQFVGTGLVMASLTVGALGLLIRWFGVAAGTSP
ncbi:hypothetical protein GCM10011390_06280 [Aureimonas endophytica]|uniref:Uncharacterized protein n=1 Tax=Aureimonas endophytica TaxID=2027858 RepID=A0A916ZDL0_9HYPH|nr:hypothetical protein [Aureimonas endophytica]GGD90241.1 hypothetical protein GCM10011390_06280 [Aureimonas endophytica]